MAPAPKLSIHWATVRGIAPSSTSVYVNILCEGEVEMQGEGCMWVGGEVWERLRPFRHLCVRELPAQGWKLGG